VGRIGIGEGISVSDRLREVPWRVLRRPSMSLRTVCNSVRRVSWSRPGKTRDCLPTLSDAIHSQGVDDCGAEDILDALSARYVRGQ